MRSLQFRQVARMVFPVALVFALHLLLRGHDRPGGGFIAGLVITTTIVLAALAFGADQVRHAYTTMLRPAAWSGLVVSAMAGLLPVAWGETVFSFHSATLVVPMLGELKLSTTLLFDVGVFMVIIGSTATAIAVFIEPEQPERVS